MSRLQKNTAEVGLELWGSRTLAGLIVTYFHVFPQTGLPVGFYLRKKIDWTRWWARWAWLGADLALLGALGWVGRGVWPCWGLAVLGALAGLGVLAVLARWLSWAWCWACWARCGRGVWPCWRWLLGVLGVLGALAGLGVVLGVGFGRAGRAGLGWAWVWRCWARWLGWAWCSK